MGRVYTGDMGIRKIAFVPGEYFHVYNRGVDKRSIFEDAEDVNRFLESLSAFNTKYPIGSIYEISFKRSKREKRGKLVDIIAYCLNPNHFHLLITPKVEGGIERFMQRLGTGYTMYFNNKCKRSGSLFQGKFQAVHVTNNAQLLHVSSYINLNNKKHQLGGKASKLVRSSWDEYVGVRKLGSFCAKSIILEQFKSVVDYQRFAKQTMNDIINRENEEINKGLLLK